MSKGSPKSIHSIKGIDNFQNTSMNKLFYLFLSLGVLQMPDIEGQGADAAKTRFNQLLQENWQHVFYDEGTSNWKELWFLDGQRAIVKNTPVGMVFSGGPIRGDNGSHGVLWTRESFEGDIKIEFDYTRLDDIDYAVNILYIQATGKGEGPYAKDISHWSHLRVVPYMRTYFMNMNLLHISFAAYPLKEGSQSDYVRARRYPVLPDQNFGVDTRISPDYDSTGLFLPGVTYHFTCIKQGDELFFNVENEVVGQLFHWNTSDFTPVTMGRIGIRHMYTRAAVYANISVSILDEQSFDNQ